MSNSFRRFSWFTLRQIFAVALIGVMILFLVPAPSGAAVPHATNDTVRSTSSRVWTWFTAALSSWGSQTTRQESGSGLQERFAGAGKLGWRML